MLRIIEKQFKQPAGFTGRIISSLLRKVNSPVYDRLINELAIKEKQTIFEIGYGPGIGVKKIFAKYDCYISGIDFSELMYKEVSKRNKKTLILEKFIFTLGIS